MSDTLSAPPRQRADEPLWCEIAKRFPNGEDCLASFLAYETAEVMDGVKPGNLINLSGRPLPCGRDLMALWKKHGSALVSRTGLDLDILRQRDDNLLLFIYRRSALQSLLARCPARALLRKAGYGEDSGLEEILAELKSRLSAGAFPHEIGLFLGYPLKDVAAFMGLASLPFACQGPWKIYGDPVKSLQVAERHRDSRSRMARRLALTDQPKRCLHQRPAGRRASVLAA